jgi:hypothetical protein
MLDIDIDGSKMRTFGPKSGAGPGGFEPPPHWDVVVQLGAQVAVEGGGDESVPASGADCPPEPVLDGGAAESMNPPVTVPASSDDEGGVSNPELDWQATSAFMNAATMPMCETSALILHLRDRDKLSAKRGRRELSGA